MHFIILSGLSGVILLLASLALLAVGRRIGKRRLEQDPSGGCAGHSAVEAAVFGLLGLLLAFTFSGALTRFDERRQLIADEANAIATAYWQADLLQPDGRSAVRGRLRQYLSARLEASRLPRVIAGGQEFLAAEPVRRSEALQSEIWQSVIDLNRTQKSELSTRCCCRASTVCLP